MSISAVDVPLPVRVLNRSGFREIRLAATPDPGRLREQAESVYRKVFEGLASLAASPEHIVSETVFFRDLFDTCAAYSRIRKGLYASGTGSDAPPVTYLQQPPCVPEHRFEIQILAVVPDEAASFARTAIEGLPTPAGGTVFEVDGVRHAYLTGLHGGDAATGFEGRTRAAFDRAAEALKSAGFSFRQVVRTWIYVPDLLTDYDALNKVRSAFFEREQITNIPASTGIQGAVFPDPVGIGLDLYALQPGPDTEILRMRAPTMNEAPTYGSRFSRGMAVVTGGRTVAYLSGTASIDAAGQVAHVGDIERQLRRMGENFLGLMSSVNAGPADLQCARMYLKDPRDLDLFHKVWASLGFPEDVPCNVVVADVCRQEWLCEVEGVAAVAASD